MSDPTPLLDAFGDLLLYPEATCAERVERCLACVDPSDTALRQPLADFGRWAASQSLGALEEQYIQAFDLSRGGTLDLGWHLFGEDYNRGLFLVKLRQLMRQLGIEETQELPDHVSLVLKVLGRLPPAEAARFAYSCVIPALRTVCEGLGADHPYCGVIDALAGWLGRLWEPPADLLSNDAEPADVRNVCLPIIQ